MFVSVYKSDTEECKLCKAYCVHHRTRKLTYKRCYAYVPHYAMYLNFICITVITYRVYTNIIIWNNMYYCKLPDMVVCKLRYVRAYLLTRLIYNVLHKQHLRQTYHVHIHAYTHTLLSYGLFIYLLYLSLIILIWQTTSHMVTDQCAWPPFIGRWLPDVQGRLFAPSAGL